MTCCVLIGPSENVLTIGRVLPIFYGTNFSDDLAGLEDFTTPIELEPNESLYDSPSRPERGLFFIERGVLVRTSFVRRHPLSIYHSSCRLTFFLGHWSKRESNVTLI